MRKIRKLTKEHKIKIGLANKIALIGHKNAFGNKHTEETRRKLRMANLGKKHTEEQKIKISLANSGIKNKSWLGDNIGYFGLHVWLKKIFGKPNKCENPNCFYPRQNRARKWILEPKQFVWANKSGKYLRDRNDFYQLCYSCNYNDGVKPKYENKK